MRSNLSVLPQDLISTFATEMHDISRYGGGNIAIFEEVKLAYLLLIAIENTVMVFICTMIDFCFGWN